MLCRRPVPVSVVLFIVLANAWASTAIGQEETNQGGRSIIDTSDILASLQKCSGPQIAVNFCARDHAEAILPVLDAAASRVRPMLDRDSDREAFDKAQNAFTNYVEAACSFDADVIYPGSLSMFEKYTCIVRRVALRIKALDDYSGCLSGRLSCENGVTLTGVELFGTN
jgi:hypothetical protein